MSELLAGQEKKPLLPTGKDTVSFSEISTWMECTWRHRLAYVEGIRPEWVDTPYNVMGSAVHEGAEHYIQTREIDPEIAVKYLDEHWTEEVERARFWNGNEERKNELQPKEWWLETARSILSELPKFMDDNFPGWEPVATELRLNESIDKQDVKFKGFIDAIITCPDKKGKKKHWIIDWKTAGWGWAQQKKSDFRVQLQLRLYKMFYSRKADIPLKDIRCAFVLLKRDAKPGSRCELLTVSVGPTTGERSLKVVNNMIASVKRGIAFKKKSEENCRWCDYRGTEHCP